MKVIILGAGVIGIATAYELLRDGHKVTVVDRQPGAAQETSFANAGLVACGHSLTWASPDIPRKLFNALFVDEIPIKLGTHTRMDFWRWSLAMLNNCRRRKAIKNTLRLHEICKYSQSRLHRIIDATNLTFDQQEDGIYFLFRNQKTLDHTAKALEVLSANGQDLQIYDREELLELDPSLTQSKVDLVGGILSATDESGDCRIFTEKLTEYCAERSVKFLFDTNIDSIAHNDSSITGIETDRGTITADAYVMCLGSYSPVLAKPLGIRLPIYPVKGYSLTFPISSQHQPPTRGGIDQDRFLAYSCLGDRLRVVSTAEFAGYDTSHSPQDFEKTIAAIQEVFPNGADYTSPEYWSCLRPMTPHGLPLYGRTRYKNLVLNTGHGQMGWTLAAGSARISADIIADKSPAIKIDGLTME